MPKSKTHVECYNFPPSNSLKDSNPANLSLLTKE